MIAIVTDSTSDLPGDLAQQYGIEIVPLYVHVGDSTFRAGVNLTNEQFLYRLQTSLELPTTEPPSVDDFCQVYERLLGKHAQIISLHISSHLSETYTRALAAKEKLNNSNIHVLDSQSVSAGLGLMVWEAARLAAEGRTVEHILGQVETIRIHHRFYFVVNTLEYLRKGGRIGGAQALLGTVLQMKPILTLQEGRIEPLETVRTKPKAIARLRQIVTDSLIGRTCIRLSVLHSAAPDEARRLEEDLVAVLEPTHKLFCEVGPVVATHAGPGTLGVAFYSDK